MMLVGSSVRVRSILLTIKGGSINKRIQSIVPPAVIDIEASGFGCHSYPIEIGVVLTDGSRFCRLIRPMTSWTHWSESAQALHGITRKHLQENGHSPAQVCRELNAFIGDSAVFSDAWVHDKAWLGKLFHDAQVAQLFSCSPIESIMTEYQYSIWDSVKQGVEEELLGERHRASADAFLVQSTFCKSFTSRSVSS